MTITEIKIKESFIIKNLPFDINVSRTMKRLQILPNSRFEKTFLTLIDQALALARPKGIFRTLPIQAKTDHTIVVENIAFTSRVLRVNLDKTDCLYPFVFTCGKEIDKWVSDTKDILHRYWMDGIVQAILFSAGNAFFGHIKAKYGLGNTAEMSPGEIDDWPLSEQENLFSLLSDPQAAIGVRLTSGFMMHPIKSRSGFLFTTEEDFKSCMLCPQPKCPGRRAPYDKGLYDRKYRL